MALKRTSVLLLIFGFLLFLFLFLLKIQEEMVDFEVCYKAGERIQWGETLYRVEDGHYQFKYSPFSSLLFLPVAFLPLSSAKVIWYFVVLFSLAGMSIISQRMVEPERKSSLFFRILPSLILAKFFLRELQLGQINAFISLILLLAIWQLLSSENPSSSTREKGAGLLWGLATALKPYALIFLPYFLLKKKWHALWPGLAILGLSFLAPSFFYGFSGTFRVLREWIRTLRASTPPLLDSQDNTSLIAFFLKWTGNQKLSATLSAAVILVLASAFLFLILKGKELPQSILLESSMLLVFIPLISPLAWDYTFLSSILGITIVLKHFFAYSKFWRIVLIMNFSVIALSLYDLLGRTLYATFMSWSVVTLNFLILLGYLFYLRIKALC